MMDFNEMVIFVKVVEAKTFTAAANQLGLPKSTVSRKISQLESRLGVRLLQRTTRSVRPTELGALYFERCERIVAEAEEAERTITQRQDKPHGLLRVTAPVDIAISFMPGVVSRFLSDYPEVKLELDVSDRYVDLVAEGFDLAIRAGRLEDSTLIAHRLYTDRLLFCATPDYLVAHGTPQKPQDLVDHDCIIFDSNRTTQTLKLKGPKDSVSVEISGQLIVNNLNAIKSACLQGRGIGTLPDTLCQEAVANGELVTLLNDWRADEGGIYAVYPSPRHLTPKVRAFIEFLDSHFSAFPGLVNGS